MASAAANTLEGIFAVTKPEGISTGLFLLELQSTFARSELFKPLLDESRRKRAEEEARQPIGQKQKDEERDGRFFKMGHGGTLDPMASGILIIGIGRGTKHLGDYLGCSKTYETEVVFGQSTDTYDKDGTTTQTADHEHITAQLVENTLGSFSGAIQQSPPAYSALKVNGMKACEYVRAGKELPLELASRSVHVDECVLLQFLGSGTHTVSTSDGSSTGEMPAVRMRLSVSSGFYVRSFAHDLGIACKSAAFMASLVRTRQAVFSLNASDNDPNIRMALTSDDLQSGEAVWGPKLRWQLRSWIQNHPIPPNVRDGGRCIAKEAESMTLAAPKYQQKFRGSLMATSKKDRIKQDGGKKKGKYNQRKHNNPEATLA